MARIKVEEQRRKQIYDTFVWPRDQTTATYSPVHEADLPSRPLSRCYRPVKWWGPFLVTGPRSATFRALPLASRLVTFTENTAQCVAVLLAKRGQMFFHSVSAFVTALTLSRRLLGKIPPVFAIQMACHFASKTGEAERTGPPHRSSTFAGHRSVPNIFHRPKT